MIDSARADQARHEGYLAAGLTSWFSGEGGPQAVAASRVLAETILQWRALMASKFEK